MARSDIPTLLSLDQFAEVIGFNYWEFNQIGESDGGTGLQFARNNQCESVMYQFSYQRNSFRVLRLHRQLPKLKLRLSQLSISFPRLNMW
jgi:hypothetical protein